MSDATDFLALPALVRGARERSAGANGLEAVTRDKPAPIVMVAADDWQIIRQHLLEQQRRLNNACEIIGQRLS